jgi:hypothetical protein
MIFAAPSKYLQNIGIFQPLLVAKFLAQSKIVSLKMLKIMPSTITLIKNCTRG